MGYFLTTLPDPPLACPVATPKTHGPFSPVKERGLRCYSPEVGRWISRDPMGEKGGVNLHCHCENGAVNTVDANGLSITKTDCENARERYMALPWVQQLLHRRSGDLLPCLMGIACKCCNDDEGGHYQPVFRQLTICWNHIGSPTDLEQLFKHELSHAESLCGVVPLTCQLCMIEEKRAYFRAGQCKKDRDCTYAAWSSCHNTNPGCMLEEFLGVGPEDYLGDGWPVDGGVIPAAPPVSRVRHTLSQLRVGR